MRFPNAFVVFGLLAILVASMSQSGCRSGGTSYAVKWAKRGEKVAKNESPVEKKDDDSPPIQQASASPEDSVTDLEIGDDAPKEHRSRWGNLFSRSDKQKRVQLPRTDLIEDEEPAETDSSFGQF